MRPRTRGVPWPLRSRWSASEQTGSGTRCESAAGGSLAAKGGGATQTGGTSDARGSEHHGIADTCAGPRQTHRRDHLHAVLTSFCSSNRWCWLGTARTDQERRLPYGQARRTPKSFSEVFSRFFAGAVLAAPFRGKVARSTAVAERARGAHLPVLPPRRASGAGRSPAPARAAHGRAQSGRAQSGRAQSGRLSPPGQRRPHRAPRRGSVPRRRQAWSARCHAAGPAGATAWAGRRRSRPAWSRAAR